MSGSRDADKIKVLNLMKDAMKALKAAKSRGVDVKPAKPLMKHCIGAFTAGDFAEATRAAEEILRQYGSVPSIG
jgi:hypothetical protein